MNLTLLLPWFPIVLAAGVGGRLLGVHRGCALGILCGLFWIALLQAAAGVALWHDPWSVAAVLFGTSAIIAMGAWSGSGFVHPTPHATNSTGDTQYGTPDEWSPGSHQIAAATRRFDEWLAEHRDDLDPWPTFDELLRSILYDCCRATHVRPYRLLTDATELAPLSDEEAYEEPQRVSARRGIVGHVATTGRPYIAEDATQGELVQRLAEESDVMLAWCFAPCQSRRRLGVVMVGQLGLPPAKQKRYLEAVERMVGQFWGSVLDAVNTRAATAHDAVSGVLTRDAFVRTAEAIVRDAYGQEEPVALAVIAIENLRLLHDTGRWDVADELVREVGSCIRRRLRFDDCFGRFDGSRLLLLLRRVDSELASLIVGQLMSRVHTLCDDPSRWGVAIRVRCGVVGSGVDKPALRALVSDAVGQCHRARRLGTLIESDLKPVGAAPGPDA